MELHICVGKFSELIGLRNLKVLTYQSQNNSRIEPQLSENVPSGHVYPAKTQISLRIRTIWSESSLVAFCIANDANFLPAYNKNSDQTQMQTEDQEQVELCLRWAHISYHENTPI